ncbi:MAG: hypothetical protein M3O36_17105 [Myxococcota bacterium]|nr:hypothetical protein [Myxococcota bacterium]
MLYRKSLGRPPTLLLRIVATAGSGVLLGGLAACSSSDSMGSVVVPMPDQMTGAGEAGACGGGACGVVPIPVDAGTVRPDADAASENFAEEAGDGPRPCAVHGICIMPAADSGGAGDAADASVDDGSLVGPDGPEGPDARLPCGTGVCGVVIFPQDAGGHDR